MAFGGSNPRSSSKKQPLFVKILLTIVMCYANFCFGFNNFVVGPSILDLARLTKTTIEIASFYFTVIQIGYTIGAFCGFIYNYINRHCCVVVILALIGIPTIFIPHSTEPYHMFICGGLVGFGMGAFDCAINVWFVEIWQDKAGPYLQISSTLYALGSIAGPMVVRPFLSSHKYGEPENQTDSDSDLSNFTSTEPGTSMIPYNLTTAMPFLNLTSNMTSNWTGLVPTYLEPSKRSKLAIPFATAGGCAVIASFMLLVLFFFTRPPKKSKAQRRMSIGSCLVDPSETPVIMFGWPAMLLTTVGAIFVASYNGLEDTYMQLFPTFAHFSDVHMSETTAASVLSATATAEMITRFLSIFLAIKLTPKIMLSANIIIIFAGLLTVLFGSASNLCMWLGNIIIGVGMASTIPSIYPFLKHYMTITNIKGSIFVSSCGVINSVLPIILSRFIKSNAIFVMYSNLILLAIVAASFVAIQFFGAMFLPKKNSKKCYTINPNLNHEPNKTGDSWTGDSNNLTHFNVIPLDGTEAHVSHVKINPIARVHIDESNRDDGSSIDSRKNSQVDSVIRNCQAIPGDIKLILLTSASPSSAVVITVPSKIAVQETRA